MIKGSVRKLDVLGRIVIPKSMRQELDIKEGDSLDIYSEDGVINMEPVTAKCGVCGSRDMKLLEPFLGGHICRECIHSVKKHF